MARFLIAPLQTGHTAAAKHVVQTVWQEVFAYHSAVARRTYQNPQALADLDDVDREYVAGGGIFVVVLDQGDVVGTGGIRRLDDDTGELRRMFLLERCRGLGIGRLLGEHLLGHARRQGFSRVRLRTHYSLTESHRLYQHLGFYLIPPYEQNPPDDAYYMECLL
jgi:putative acetyltransferase